MSDSLARKERSQRASIARGYGVAKYGTAHLTKAAQHAANVTRFERQVDPDGELPAQERAKRADHARKAYMRALSLKAVAARRAKAAATQDGAAA